MATPAGAAVLRNSTSTRTWAHGLPFVLTSPANLNGMPRRTSVPVEVTESSAGVALGSSGAEEAVGAGVGGAADEGGAAEFVEFGADVPSGEDMPPPPEVERERLANS